MLIPLHHLFELSSFRFDTETKENDFPDDLSPIAPRFFVPLLEDKPQNPILESLRLEAANLNLPDRRVKVKNRVRDKEPPAIEGDEVLPTESAETKLDIRVCKICYLLQNTLKRTCLECNAFMGQTPSNASNLRIPYSISFRTRRAHCLVS